LDCVWAVITNGPAGPMGLVAEETINWNYKRIFFVGYSTISYEKGRIQQHISQYCVIQKLLIISIQLNLKGLR